MTRLKKNLISLSALDIGQGRALKVFNGALVVMEDTIGA